MICDEFTSSVLLYPLNTMLYTRFSAEPPTDAIRAGYHCPSPEYFARHSSPAAHTFDEDALLAEALAAFLDASALDDDAAASCWAIAACVSSMSSLSSSGVP